MWIDHMSWGGMWMMFPMTIFLVLLILVPLFVWRGTRFDNSRKETETALDILKKRYAKGEISKEEFEQIKKDIAS